MKKNIFSRRKFLQSATIASMAALASTALPTRLLAAPVLGQDMDKEMRLMMGTTVSIVLHGQSKEQRVEALSLAFKRMEQEIAVFDRHSQSSALGILNAEGRLSDAPKSLVYVLEQSTQLGQDSGYMFNPALLPALSLFEASKTSRAKVSIDQKELQAALELADPQALQVKGRDVYLEKAGMGLTLDGIAKGYIIDMATIELRRLGFNDFMINAGGDIVGSGHNPYGKPWQLGIANPASPETCIAACAISNRAMATSGGYERFFDASKESNHLLNPRTGKSPAVGSVTVVAPTGTRADALATTASMLPVAEAQRFVEAYAGCSCLIVGMAGEIYKSPSWQA